VAMTTLTVATSAENAAPSPSPSTSVPASAMALVFCCLGWKRRRGARMLLLAGVAGVGMSLCTGCGANVPAIAATTSTVSLIATDGNLQPSTSFTLTIQ
jgi:hypothetical protein